MGQFLNMSSSNTSNSSVDFQSAQEDEEEISGIKMGGNNEADVFETSDNLEIEDAEKSRGTATANSSACSSKEEIEAWARFPEGTKEICNQASGVLYMERFESFINNNWPYDVKRGNLCHPRALALSGLVYESLEPAPSAKCAVCFKILHNLQPNSNPWILHSEISPDCYIVRLGQRDKVDDYSMDEIMEMITIKICNEAASRLMDKERKLKKQLFALRQHELELGLRN